MRRLVILLLALLSAGALCAQTTHPPTMASVSLPTCDVSRDGTWVSLVDASTTLDCNTTGGGNVTSTCKCEQQSVGVFAWVGVSTGAHTVDTDTDDQDGAEVTIDDTGAFYTTDNVEAALQQVGPTMTNARTPTAHASTHADGQNDELTGTHGIDITGNAATANSLSSNPANCALGLAARGVDASGAGEDCFDVLTQVEGDALNLALDDLADNVLGDLSDVDLTGAGIGEGLVWDGDSWVMSADALCLANGTNCPAGGGTIGGTFGSLDNLVPRADGTGGVTAQGSDLVIADAVGASVTVSTTPGNALVVQSTAPTATVGASQVGKNATFSASPAMASTDTAGAAAGGAWEGVGGDAARNTSGNADGGQAWIKGGRGIGTGLGGVTRLGKAGDRVCIGDVEGATLSNAACLRAAIIRQIEFVTNATTPAMSHATASGYRATTNVSSSDGNIWLGSVHGGNNKTGLMMDASQQVCWNGSGGQAGFVATTACLRRPGANSTIAQDGGNFAATGDAQATSRVLRLQTTTATQSEMFLDGSAARMVLANDTTWTFSCTVVARRTDADNESAGYKLEGIIDRQTNAASTALVGTVTITVLAEDTAAWDVTAEADATNGALVLKVTGEASKTIRWVSSCDNVEVTG